MENTVAADGLYPPVPPFYLVGFLGFPIFQRILNSAIRILQSQLGADLNVQPERQSPNPEQLNKQLLSFDEEVVDDDDDDDDGKQLCQGVEMVMEKLGISCDPDGDEKLFQERLGSDGILKLFEDKDPTSEELKEAFEVFDENRDGYIDAEELQRVLCDLGFVEGLELGDCKRMIAAFDTNEDGRIDFDEFAKIMKISFC